MMRRALLDLDVYKLKEERVLANKIVITIGKQDPILTCPITLSNCSKRNLSVSY